MKNKSKIAVGGMTSAIICALVGSITGTFAWYAYSTRGTATFGSKIYSNVANLQLGIETKNDYHIAGLEAPDENGVCWCPLGGGLHMDSIKDYLKHFEFAGGDDESVIKPTTSGRLTEKVIKSIDEDADITAESIDSYKYEVETKEVETDIKLYDMPEYQKNTDYSTETDTKNYFYLPIVMRISDLKGEYLENKPIYLSDADITLEKEGTTLKEAFRMNFKSYNDNKEQASYKIFNPGKADGSSTVLGGILDLNLDGYIDVEETDYEYLDRHEMAYGLVEGKVAYSKYELNKFYKADYYLTNEKNPEYYNEVAKYVKTDTLNDDYALMTKKTLSDNSANPHYVDNTAKNMIVIKDGENFVAIENPDADINNDKEPLKYVYELNSDPDYAEHKANPENYIAVRDGDDIVVMDKPNNFVGDGSLEKLSAKVDDEFKVADADLSKYFLVEKADGSYEKVLAPVDKNNVPVFNEADEEAYKYVMIEVSDEQRYENIKDLDYDVKHKQVLSDGVTDNPLYDANAKQTYKVDLGQYVKKEAAILAKDVLGDPNDFDIHNPQFHEGKTYRIDTANTKFAEQSWLGTNDLITEFDGNELVDQNAASKIITTTGANGLAHVDLTIWVEGWDEAVNDTTLGVSFFLGLQFQIEKLD